MNQTALLILMLGPHIGAEPSAEADGQLVRAWHEVCTARAEAYEIRATDGPRDTFKLLSDPVLYHSRTRSLLKPKEVNHELYRCTHIGLRLFLSGPAGQSPGRSL